MVYIWNIYEPNDPNDYEPEDPFDVFLYSMRMDEAPLSNAPLYIEGRRCRIIAIVPDRAMDEVCGFGQECYYKVCVI